MMSLKSANEIAFLELRYIFESVFVIFPLFITNLFLFTVWINVFCIVSSFAQTLAYILPLYFGLYLFPYVDRIGFCSIRLQGLAFPLPLILKIQQCLERNIDNSFLTAFILEPHLRLFISFFLGAAFSSLYSIQFVYCDKRHLGRFKGL